MVGGDLWPSGGVLVAAFQERPPKLSFQPKSLWTEGTGEGVLAAPGFSGGAWGSKMGRFITLELTFCRLLSKEGANQELAGGGLEAGYRTIPCPQPWQGPMAARRDLGKVKAKSIW